MDKKGDLVTFTGNYAASLSLVEIGLGSILHSFKIPMSGQFLSLNQGFILTLASIRSKQIDNSTLVPSHISLVSSLLKSLSPAGKKLTPMLAIAAQGQLFNLGQLILGRNLLGHILGMVLLSVWAFVQPFLLYLLIFGRDLIFMSEYFVKKISKVFAFAPQYVWYALLAIVATKVFLGIIVAIMAHRLPEEKIEQYFNWISKNKRPKKEAKKISPLKGTFKDLTSPLFIVSMILTFIYFYFARSTNSQLIWALLRPLALAFILFYFIRVFPVENLVKSLEGGRFNSLSQALNIALTKLKNK